MAAMLSKVVVGMMHEFCVMARSAINDAGEEPTMLDSRSGSVLESMACNLNGVRVMNFLASFVCNAPENIFIDPYCPAQSP